ncbi:MAG: hypothetical protein ABMB14_12715 [Myxococcota bacterium]
MPLAVLWERFLVRRLALLPEVQEVHGQRFLGHLIDAPRKARQVVDLVVRLRTGAFLLLDAKYKAATAPSVQDLRQILVYGALWDRKHGAPGAVGLVYPSRSDAWEVGSHGRAGWATPDELEVFVLQVPFQVPGRGEAPPSLLGDRATA